MQLVLRMPIAFRNSFFLGKKRKWLSHFIFFFKFLSKDKSITRLMLMSKTKLKWQIGAMERRGRTSTDIVLSIHGGIINNSAM